MKREERDELAKVAYNENRTLFAFIEARTSVIERHLTRFTIANIILGVCVCVAMLSANSRLSSAINDVRLDAKSSEVARGESRGLTRDERLRLDWLERNEASLDRLMQWEGFEDEDEDTVPDAFDRCPGTFKTSAVNTIGCEPDQVVISCREKFLRLMGLPEGRAAYTSCTLALRETDIVECAWSELPDGTYLFDDCSVIE